MSQYEVPRKRCISHYSCLNIIQKSSIIQFKESSKIHSSTEHLHNAPTHYISILVPMVWPTKATQCALLIPHYHIKSPLIILKNSQLHHNTPLAPSLHTSTNDTIHKSIHESQKKCSKTRDMPRFLILTTNLSINELKLLTKNN